MQYDQHDVESMALCAWKESRGEGLYGCFLVMQVIFNRVGRPGFAKTIHDVIYGKNQFTSMSVPSDPEFNLEPTQTTDPTAIYQACLVDARNILMGTNDDPTHGGVYYANEAIEHSGWYYENIIQKPALHPITLVYKHHTFRK